MTVIAAARRHHIPSRPPGVHSRPEMITTLSGDIPIDIRHAVEGGLQGWHRLRRFQTAMTFPTIEAAAINLSAHQSALIHQFRRLEHDIGTPALPPLHAPPAHAPHPARHRAPDRTRPARHPGNRHRERTRRDRPGTGSSRPSQEGANQ
jgi:hypothetical protein